MPPQDRAKSMQKMQEVRARMQAQAEDSWRPSTINPEHQTLHRTLHKTLNDPQMAVRQHADQHRSTPPAIRMHMMPTSV